MLSIAIIISCSNTSLSQSSSTLMGPRAGGTGYTTACVADAWSLFNNVAGLGKISAMTASCAYDAQAALKAFSKAAFVFSLPGKVASAIGFYRFGSADYQEQIVTLGIGTCWQATTLGMKVNYIRYSASALGDKSAYTVSLGGITALTSKLTIGAHILNVNQPFLSRETEERVPVILIAGLRFKASEKLFLMTEIEKDMDYPAVLKGGMEYTLHKKVCVRSGFNIHPEAAFFGFDFRLKKFSAGYSVQYSLTLGSRHQAGIHYYFKKETS